MAGGRRLKRAAMAALAVAASTALSGCGGGSMFGGSSGSSSTSSSIGSRFSQLFGSKSQEATTSSTPSSQATENSDLSCPSVAIRFGASTLAVGSPGKPASGNDLRYQGSITRTARDCNLQGGQITARIGIMGRIIAGPAGAPPTVDVPMRVAVVQEGAPEKVIVTKAFRTTVTMEGENTEFSIVAEDVVYPTPTEAANDKYIFYVGFDPAALKPEPAARKRKK
ncbi:hypothetical protein [Afipia birgiae]|uniref:hypothetical protein n=1 Tax=Afipia birgiae TaxID=151414 RepID=UPI0002E96343|nr:hypothetical protein [Afipia birgiae]MBX9821759.1 hypothetical protein [Afipia birgiae]